MKEYYLAHAASPEVHHGPYTLDVIWDWINSNQIHPEGWHITDGHEPWVPLPEFAFPSANVMHDPSLSQELPEEDETILPFWGKPEKPKTKKALQKNIRSLLNQLWAAHRELFITGEIYDELPDDRYDEIKTRSEQIKKEILLQVEEYCAVSGKLDKWIHEMVANPKRGTTGIYKIELQGDGFLERFHFAEKWLHQTGLHEQGGCYCFKKRHEIGKEEEYIYIGQSTDLHGRLKSYYSHKGLWEEATHLKILQPHHHKDEVYLKQLERLLLVRYWQTRYNIKKEEPAHTDDEDKLLKQSPLDQLLHRVKTRMDFFFHVPKEKRQPKKKVEATHPKPGNDPALVHFISKEVAETDDAAQA